MDKKYLRNTAILFASMTITKIVGALFKIPLANVLGGTGMGYFSTAYGLYSPVFAVTAAGIPTVMMRITAQNIAAGRQANARKIRHTAMLLFSGVGLLGTLIVALFAPFFAEHIACSPESTPSVIAIAPAVMLCCVASVIRGYHEGMSDVMPSAAASVAEAVSRAVFGLAMAYGILFYTQYRVADGLSVFGVTYPSYEEAYIAVLPAAAAAAVLAVSISELCGLISLLISDRKKRLPDGGGNSSTDRMRTIAGKLIKEILPVAASALVMNCVSFVDLITVPRTLRNTAAANSGFFLNEFADILPACGGLEGLSTFMYGSYTGIAITVFMLIPSFAGMSEKTALPEIAAAWERKNIPQAAAACRTLFRTAAIIGFPACAGAAVLSEPLLSMLYSSRAAEVSVCCVPFSILCVGGFFMIISSAMFGIFQIIGKAHIPLLLMTASVGIKAALSPLLMSIPRLNLTGAAISTAFSYFFMAIVGSILLKKYISADLSVFSCVVSPLVCSLLCAGSAYAVNKLIFGASSSIVCVAVSVVSGAIIYGLSLIMNSKIRKIRQ